jgi:cell division septum initiation protein DivIVA
MLSQKNINNIPIQETPKSSREYFEEKIGTLKDKFRVEYKKWKNPFLEQVGVAVESVKQGISPDVVKNQLKKMGEKLDGSFNRYMNIMETGNSNTVGMALKSAFSDKKLSNFEKAAFVLVAKANQAASGVVEALQNSSRYTEDIKEKVNRLEQLI